jgi:hypothetical protein
MGLDRPQLFSIVSKSLDGSQQILAGFNNYFPILAIDAQRGKGAPHVPPQKTSKFGLTNVIKHENRGPS